jgi:hypothetical protein
MSNCTRYLGLDLHAETITVIAECAGRSAASANSPTVPKLCVSSWKSTRAAFHIDDLAFSAECCDGFMAALTDTTAVQSETHR